jgi:hypothetical protein
VAAAAYLLNMNDLAYAFGRKAVAGHSHFMQSWSLLHLGSDVQGKKSTDHKTTKSKTVLQDAGNVPPPSSS